MRIAVNGSMGKMGKLACQAISAHPNFELVELSRNEDLATQIQKLDIRVVVDLTRADCVYANSLAIIKAGAHPVIGSSGLTKTQIEHLQKLCTEKQLGGVIAPNFSIAAVLMMHFAAIAVKYLPDAEIIEAHHPEKYDSPSGTAIKTALMMNKQAPTNTTEKQTARGNLDYGVPIHAIRLPGFVATQQVIFGNLGETLTITHASIDRLSFMPGVILCCEKVESLSSLIYGMEHLLHLN